MGVLKTKLEWYGNKGNITTAQLLDFTKVNIRVADELKNNMMTITLENNFGRVTSTEERREWTDSSTGKIKFHIDDKFMFYCKLDKDNSGLGDNDLIFSGDLREIKSKVDDNKATIELKCPDRSYNLLNGLWWANYKTDDTKSLNGEGWTAPLIVQNVVRHVAATNKRADTSSQWIFDEKGNKAPEGYDKNSAFLLIDSRLKSEGGFIQDNRTVTIDKNGVETTRSSFGTPDTTNSLFPTKPVSTRNYNFPFKNYVASGKPVYEILLNLSQLDMTNTIEELNPANTGSFTPVIRRAMRFYIDEKNRFHWFYPYDNTFDTANDLTTNSKDKFGNLLNIVMGTTTTHEVKNQDMDFAIYDVINYIYYEAGKDMNGNSILGFRYDATSGAPVSKMSKRAYPQIAEQMKQLDANEKNIVLDATKNGGYAYPTSYSPAIKPAWDTTLSITSDAQYNKEFRRVAKEIASMKAWSIIKGTSSQKWKGKIEFSFYNFTIGDLIQYTSTAGGIKNEKLRIKDITHNIQKGSAMTTLTLEVDEKELTQ